MVKDKKECIARILKRKLQIVITKNKGHIEEDSIKIEKNLIKFSIHKAKGEDT
jgi:hypothetical protein